MLFPQFRKLVPLLIPLKPSHLVLVHCNRGRHRVGLLCALVRRVQKWSFTMIFEEYRLFFGHGNGEGKTVARVGDYEVSRRTCPPVS